MNNPDNNQILRELIAEYELRHKDIIELLSSQYGAITASTIEKWVSNDRNMPGIAMELLQCKIKDALAAQQGGKD